MSRAVALSPSRMGDYKQCPLLYRLRAIDRLPEPTSAAQALGTLVHLVLERLFDEAPAARDIGNAKRLLHSCWEELVAVETGFQDLDLAGSALTEFLVAGEQRLEKYFQLEVPENLQPSHREVLLEYQLPDGPLLRGIIDRIETTATGEMRVVDYKTGRAPNPAYRNQAKTQMQFYALLINAIYDQPPRLLRLLYLKDGVSHDLMPDAADLDAISNEVRYVWGDITANAAAGDFPPRKSRLCDWCSFQELCPAFSGTPPELSATEMQTKLGLRS